MSPDEVRVVLVDDHPIVRDGLRGQINSHPTLRVVGQAATAEEALVVLEHTAAEVLITDLRMPGQGGLKLIREARDRHPTLGVLVLTTFDTDTEITEALTNGAGGYLLKDASRTTICCAIQDVVRGHTVLSSAVAHRARKTPPTNAEPTLTRREHEVLRLIAQGLTNAQTGRELYIGESTVKTHLLHIFAKLGAADRAAAVSIAHQRRLL